MARASIKVTKTHTRTKSKPKTSKKKGNPNRCPTCGKFTSKNG